jgi:hypothetical protein
MEEGRRSLLSKEDGADDGSGSCGSGSAGARGGPSQGAATSEKGGGMLQEYSTEFQKLHARLNTRLQAARDARGAAWADEAKIAEALLEEMESNKRQVQVQLRLGLSGAVSNTASREDWDALLQEWSNTTLALRKNLENIKAERSRRSLQLPTGGDDAAALAIARNSMARQGAQHSNERLQQSTQKLEEARRQAIETESVSHGVLNDLAAQGEQIRSVSDNMKTVSAELDAARRSLNQLLLVAQQNRLITMVVVATLAVCLAFWGLEILGLPFKWNLLMALAAVFAGGSIRYLRARMQAKQAAREEVADASDHYHLSVF